MYRIEPNNIAIEIPVAVLFWLVNASLKKLCFPSTTLKTIDHLRMDVKYYVPASTLNRNTYAYLVSRATASLYDACTLLRVI